MLNVFGFLLIAHCFGDYFVHPKPNTIARAAIRAGTVGALAALLLFSLPGFMIGLVLFGLYYVINRRPGHWPATDSDPEQSGHGAGASRAFFWDQLLKLVVLLLLAVVSQFLFPLFQTPPALVPFSTILLVLAGFAAAIYGADRFIPQLLGEIAQKSELDRPHLLVDDGRMIGRLERALIYLLYILEMPWGIAVIAVLDVALRFRLIRHPKLSEYLLMSLLLNIAVGLIVGIVVRDMPRFE